MDLDQLIWAAELEWRENKTYENGRFLSYLFQLEDVEVINSAFEIAYSHWDALFDCVRRIYFSDEIYNPDVLKKIQMQIINRRTPILVT